VPAVGGRNFPELGGSWPDFWRGGEDLTMSHKLRQAAFVALLGICLAGLSATLVTWAQGSETAKGENSEPPNELLYKFINFAILAGGLGYILRKPTAEFFGSRSASIQKSLDEGRKALEASQARLKVVEDKLKGLEAEIAAVHPQLIVCLGATAAQSLLGAQFRLTKHRGEVFPTGYGPVTATIHPSAILRMPEPAAKDAEIASLVQDLKMAAEYSTARRPL